jgi:hypothetical protein
MKAGAGLDLSFEVRIEAKDGSTLSPEAREKLNDVLRRVSDELQF